MVMSKVQRAGRWSLLALVRDRSAVPPASSLYAEISCVLALVSYIMEHFDSGC